MNAFILGSIYPQQRYTGENAIQEMPIMSIHSYSCFYQCFVSGETLNRSSIFQRGRLNRGIVYKEFFHETEMNITALTFSFNVKYFSQLFKWPWVFE